MTYNPVLQRWEGNEAVLREFDKALTTSTRPALISPFSSAIGSPHRGSLAPPRPAATQVAADIPLPAKPVLPPGATPSASRGTAKVVGNMVFDPATCSWHAVDGPDAEDELELDWGGGASGGEAADDESASASALGASSDVDGWELGERERMLKNRASFVLEEGSDEDGAPVEAVDAREGEGARRRAHTTRRQILRESEAAEARSRVELAPWRTREADEGTERRWLWELRAVRPLPCSLVSSSLLHVDSVARAARPRYRLSAGTADDLVPLLLDSPPRPSLSSSLSSSSPLLRHT